MNPKAQAQFDTLGQIKNKLVDIRDNRPEARAAIENTELGGALGNVFKDLQVENGVLTSRSANQAVESANKNISSTTGRSTTNDPFKKLQESYQRVSKQLEQEKATREGLEADLSIADKLAQREAQQAAVAGGTGVKAETDGQTIDGEQPAQAVGATADTTMFGEMETNDPIIQANIVRMQEQSKLIAQQIDALDSYVDASEDDNRAMIENIRRTAENQTARAEKENARLAQAARVAGITVGRGMYSPEEHEGIISETIQDGLDRIVDIENTRDGLILEAKKAQREFAYKAFVEMSDMVDSLSDLKSQTIIDINTRLNEIEVQAREQIKFDQEQADRNAFILAPELEDASPDEIYKAALANGIEPGLLAREVQAYADQNKLTQLDIAQAEASLIGTRISNSISQKELDSLRSGVTGEIEEPLTPDEIKKWTDLLGLKGETDGETQIPPTWTRTDINNFITLYPDAPVEDTPRLIEQYNAIIEAEATGNDLSAVPRLYSQDETVNKVVTSLKEVMVDEGWFGRASAAGKMAEVDGVALGIRPGGGDAKTWFNSKGKKEITNKATDLFEQGYEWYQIFDIIADEYANLTGVTLERDK